MNNKVLVICYICAIFTPALVEHLVYAQGQIDLLPWAKLLVHFGIPIIFTVLFFQRSWRAVFLEPLRPKKSGNLRKEMYIATGVGVLAATVIIGSYFFLRDVVDVAGIASNLTAQGISKGVYPLIALWIAFINPFMEEYFWRSFVFYRGYQMAQSVGMKRVVLFGTGLLFALHHTIIIQPWFNWWQFILVTLFLAVAGVLFNILYKRSGSIYPSLLVHFSADFALAILGMVIFGYITI